jgi:hypothetical protein
MRPQQQNRRMRGRGNNNNNNNNRRGPNPLTRNYESNGPDVKIRGSAQQIAEKYANLARDAQSAGDRVMAENYLQHAEHYNRIIAAAQAQMPQQQTRDNREFDDQDDDRDDFDAPQNSEHQQSQRANDGSGPQPVIEGMPVEVEQEVANREAAQPQQVNGGHGNGDASEEGAPRRSRRPRRSRGRGDQEPGSEAQADSDGSAQEADEKEIVVPVA